MLLRWIFSFSLWKLFTALQGFPYCNPLFTSRSNLFYVFHFIKKIKKQNQKNKTGKPCLLYVKFWMFVLQNVFVLSGICHLNSDLLADWFCQKIYLLFAWVTKKEKSSFAPLTLRTDSACQTNICKLNALLRGKKRRAETCWCTW